MNNLEVVLLLVIVGLINGMDSRALKRSETKTENNLEKAEEYPTKVNYDVYPLVFPKRAAMLLDRLMVALHHALEDDDQTEIKKINDLYRNGQFASQYKAQMDLQRRGHNAGLGPNKGRVYWRCYFNAVTCF
ncbi:unnamed protein product [Diamesa tonsa]